MAGKTAPKSKTPPPAKGKTPPPTKGKETTAKGKTKGK